MNSQLCTLVRLGPIDYQSSHKLQQAAAKARKMNLINDTLLLGEHPNVFTVGRRGKLDDVLADTLTLAKLGVSVYKTDRGGEVTYHGPGQIVGYPVLNIQPLGGPRRYVWGLEEAILAVLDEFGVNGGRRIPGLTGVWVGEKKVAAIGIRVSQNVTTHGFALNANTDLTYFNHIVPCGEPNRRATSLAEVLGNTVDLARVESAVARNFAKVFGFQMMEANKSTLASKIQSGQDEAVSVS